METYRVREGTRVKHRDSGKTGIATQDMYKAIDGQNRVHVKWDSSTRPPTRILVSKLETEKD